MSWGDSRAYPGCVNPLYIRGMVSLAVRVALQASELQAHPHPLKLAPVEGLGPELPPSHCSSVLPPLSGIPGAVRPADGPQVAVGRPG